MTTQEIIEVIKGLSVLELNDLVKACEEEFGVSAAAGVVVAAAGAGAAAGEEKTEFDVELTEAGANKVKVIKVVREIRRSLKLKALRLLLSNFTHNSINIKLRTGFLRESGFLRYRNTVRQRCNS